MTRPEFDAWIEQHYGELLAVARKHGSPEPEDVVQRTVEIALSHVEEIRPDAVWSWMARTVTGEAANNRRLRSRRLDANREIQRASRLSHGWKRPAPRAE